MREPTSIVRCSYSVVNSYPYVANQVPSSPILRSQRRITAVFQESEPRHFEWRPDDGTRRKTMRLGHEGSPARYVRARLRPHTRGG